LFGTLTFALASPLFRFLTPALLVALYRRTDFLACSHHGFASNSRVMPIAAYADADSNQ
jgi:hypothetical protein